MKTVGIIGGSHCIESNIVAIFLNAHYYVKIATEDILKKQNYEHLMNLGHHENLHVCELDFKSKSALNNFLKDCDYSLYLNTEGSED
ncbi:MAG: hypothetical protein ACOH2D_10020 [Gelidibacter sp.]|uniref:hypothetical protein n=1 Tax=Gelidibacter sp. TaxID=2018083 RepID=UPI003267772F